MTDDGRLRHETNIKVNTNYLTGHFPQREREIFIDDLLVRVRHVD